MMPVGRLKRFLAGCGSVYALLEDRGAQPVRDDEGHSQCVTTRGPSWATTLPRVVSVLARSGSSASLGRGVPWGLVSHGLLTVTRACLPGTGAAARTDGWHLPARPTSTVPEPLNASQSRP